MDFDNETVTIAIDEKATTSAIIARPDGFESGAADCMVWAHGAGSDMRHPIISYFHTALAKAGWLSVKFNFLYKEQGRRAPDTAVKLENTFARVLDFVRDDDGLRPPRIFAGGKSMGGRIASQVVARRQDVRGLIFLGYPLHAPNRHEKLRTEHLKQVRCPMLFIEGTSDPFCRLDLLARTREALATSTELHMIEGGNHDFRVPKRLGRSPEQILEEVASVICETLTRWSGP